MALFDSVDQVSLALSALAGMIATATFDTGDAMGAAAGAPVMAATDLAEWLVARGTPFVDRPRHRRRAGPPAPGRRPSAGASWSPPTHRLGPDAAALVAPGVAVARRTSPGAAGPVALPAQLVRYRALLESQDARLG